MKDWLLAGLLVLVAAASLPARDEAKPQSAPVVLLAPQAPPKGAGPLAYRLLPDPLDMVEGNAAPIWIRASLAARSVRFHWTQKEWKWLQSGDEGTALKDFPQKDARAILDKHAAALRLARQAALRTRCDWDRPAPTMQNIAEDIGLDEIQTMREMASMLNLRCRLALSEKDFDAALETLQTGFTLARHLTEGHTSLIQDLVALAIAHIMLGRVEEWVQIPGSPNLYWALTDLPRPFIEIRRCVRTELGTLYRSFPQLRELKKKNLAADEARALVEKLFEVVSKFTERPSKPAGDHPSKVGGKLAVAALAIKHYPEAKKALIAAGRPEKEVEAMPALQVVALHFLEQYDRVSSEVLQWLAVPAWQGLEHLQKAEAAHKPGGPTDGNIFVTLLMPAITKTYHAQLRLERYLAGYRGAEALRQYAFTHGGKAPATWADLPLPDPIDPFTGKGLGPWYKHKDGKGVLDLPPPPAMPPLLGRRYVLGGEGKGESR